MDTIKRFNEALALIEASLDGEVNLGRVAQTAGCSEYHFKRMFSFLAGMPLSEYVRKRRLAQAAVRLMTTDIKVVDLALDTGYSTPDAFTKAFSAMHGISPREARKAGEKIKAFPPLSFQLKVQGGKEMNYRIIVKQGFHIVGVKKRITLVYEGVNNQIDSLWQSLTEEDFRELKSLNDTDPHGIICASANFTEGRAEGTELDQYVGVAVSEEAPVRWEALYVEPSQWAVFTAVGSFPEALQEVWARIYAEWFPGSGYELTGGPEILWNESPDTTKADYKSEIWIPVRKLK